MVSQDIFHQRGLTLLYRTFYLIIQTLLYGIYMTLIPISTYIIIKKGLKLLSQKILFGVIVFMFSLSTAFLAVSIVDLIVLIKTWYLDEHLSELAGDRRTTESLLVLFNALAVINYALTDGVVVWRAWVICRDDHRKLLTAPTAMFILTILTVAATIGVRVFITFHPVYRQERLATTINVLQETTLISSLVTNMLGTGVISLKAWKYRRWIVTDLQRIVDKRTRAERVMALLIESGVFYIFSGSLLVAASVIELPGSHFKLGSLYSQAAVHLAGMYPVVVVILVKRQTSMDQTLFNPNNPVIVADLQEASSQLIASQTATRTARLHFMAAPGLHRTRSSLELDASLSQDSRSSTEHGSDLEIRLESGGGVE